MSVQRHTLYNLLGALLPLAASLATIPLYLDRIGAERYGVLAIAWLFLGYFGLFDLGLGRATARSIAALREGPAQARADTYSTALLINLGLGCVGGLLIWPALGYFFQHFFNADAALKQEVVQTLPWMVAAVPMATAAGVMTGGLQGREKFLALNVNTALGAVLFQVLPLLAAIVWGGSLAVVLPAALFARMCTVLWLGLLCRQHVQERLPGRFVWPLGQALLGYGGWVTLTSLVSPMMVMLDRVIIGAVSGAKAVTHYTVPFQLGERTTVISASLSSALFPRMAGASRQREQALAHEAVASLLTVMTPLTCAGIVLMGPFLGWWIGREFAEESASAGRLILVGFWVNSLAAIPYTQLQARGRPDLVAKVHVAELLPYFGLLYLGLNQAGMAGAAAAFATRVAVDFVLLAGLSGVWGAMLRAERFRLLLPPSLIALACLVAWWPPQDTWARAFCHLLLAILAVAWAGWQAPERLRAAVLRQLAAALSAVRR